MTTQPARPLLDNAFARLQMAASHAATSPYNDRPDPTAAQAIAGNYKKAPYRWSGLLLVLENTLHSVRTGKSPDGKQWANRLAAHYGEIAGTVGADGDPIDIFFGHFPESPAVWVINQAHEGGGFDEHKVMLGFATAAQARDAYDFSFDRDWTGFMSMVPCSIAQLKWWLKYGDKSRQFSLDQLPYDGQPSMKTTLWNANAEPITTPMHKLVYDLRSEDAAGLLLDAVTMADILGDPDIEKVGMLDALVVEVAKMTQKMNLLQRVMSGSGAALTATEYQISDPVRSRGVMQVAVLFQLSDGQTVTVWFHNPDTTPAKLMPLDELISWKWMLNKKDITIVVAPERGVDLNVREVARRIMRLAERNSAAFAKANARLATKIEEGFRLDSEIVGLEKKLADVTHRVEVAKQRRVDAGATATGDEWSEINPNLTKAEQDALEARHAALAEQLAAMPEEQVRLVAASAPLTINGAERGDRDDITAKILANHPDDIEAAIAKNASYQAPAAAEDAGTLPDGWSEASPGGMATNTDPLRGGIVDKNPQLGKWFFVFNSKDMPHEEAWFDTRAEAFAAFEAKLAAVTPAAIEPSAEKVAGEQAAAIDPAPAAEVKPKRVTKKEANNASDSLAWALDDLAGHTPLEFLRADVPARLAAPVAAVQALVERGWPEGVVPPENKLARAASMIDRWNAEREEGDPAEMGRGDASRYLREAGLTDEQAAPILANPTSTETANVGQSTVDVPRYTRAYLDEKIASAKAEQQTAADPAPEQSHSEWIAEVTRLVAEQTGADDGDAAGIVEGQEFVLAQQWGMGNDAATAAAAVVKAATTAAPRGDISYRAVDDMFTSFYPDTQAGEEAWNVINATEGSEGGKVLTQHAASVIEQLRAAGYTVTEAAPVTESADELLAELNNPADTIADPVPTEPGQVAPQPADDPAPQAGAATVAEEVQPEPEPALNQEPSIETPAEIAAADTRLAVDISPAAEAPVDPAAEMAQAAESIAEPPAADPQEAADREFLQGIIDGTGDVLADDTFDRMEPLFAKYPEGSEMYLLLEQAAEAFAAAAEQVSVSLAAQPA